MKKYRQALPVPPERLPKCVKELLRPDTKSISDIAKERGWKKHSPERTEQIIRSMWAKVRKHRNDS